MPFPGLRSSEILLNIKQLFPFLPFSGFDSTTFTTPLTFKTFATKKWSQLNEIEWQILRMCKSSTSPTLLKIDTAAFMLTSDQRESKIHRESEREREREKERESESVCNRDVGSDKDRAAVHSSYVFSFVVR